MILSKEVWPWVTKFEADIYQARQNWPKISIVTPSYNQALYLEETILSVINQHYPNIEFIIIDGGSTDHSVDIIKKYERHLAYWMSEKDKGQADAITKGLKICTGEIFNWINSDDLLAEKALLTLAETYLKNQHIKIIAGGCTHFVDTREDIETTFVKDLSFEGLISEKSHFQQPAQWIITNKVKNLSIDTNLDYSFDWGMILNIELQKKEVRYLHQNLAYFREHVHAKTATNALAFKYEKLDIVKKYYKNTSNLRKKLILFQYIFRLKNYLKVVAKIEKGKKNKFLDFFVFGIKSPSLFLIKFYLGHLKNLLNGKENH